MRRGVVGASVAVASICGMAGYGGAYAAWSFYDLTLASDDFWDRCRNPETAQALGQGRYEAVVWSRLNDAGQCEDVLGYCIVNKRDEGTLFGDAFEEHQVARPAERPENCTFLGWMSSEKPPFKKVN